jgi:hypothetical protein
MLALFWMIAFFHLYWMHWARRTYWREVHLSLGR